MGVASLGVGSERSGWIGEVKSESFSDACSLFGGGCRGSLMVASFRVEPEVWDE